MSYLLRHVSLLGVLIAAVIIPGNSAIASTASSDAVRDSTFAILMPQQNNEILQTIDSNWNEVDGIVFYRHLLWEPEKPEEFEAHWGVLKSDY